MGVDGGHVSMSSNIRRGRLCAYVSEKLICCSEEDKYREQSRVAFLAPYNAMKTQPEVPLAFVHRFYNC